jgi:hypothetical protein
VVANEYHDRPAVQIAAYGIASAVSVSRFTGLHHYLSDVLVGARWVTVSAVMSIMRIIAASATSSGGDEERTRSFSRSKRLPAIAPMYNRNAHDYGVALAWSF